MSPVGYLGVSERMDMPEFAPDGHPWFCWCRNSLLTGGSGTFRWTPRDLIPQFPPPPEQTDPWERG